MSATNENSMYKVTGALGASLKKGLSFLGLGYIIGNNSGAREVDKNVGQTSMRIPLQRIVQSIQNWRDGTNEAEYYIPFRVKQQQLYNDLQDEPHIAAAAERRMDLTLQRDFVVDCGNERDTTFWTHYLKGASWFINFQRAVLTAQVRGYSLIPLGNIVTDNERGLVNDLPELKILEHSLVSPDRRNFVPVVYTVEGVQWDEEPYKSWHIFVGTYAENGNGCCGYGLLHKIAVQGIILRNNYADWANYNEKFGQPVRWGKTHKQDQERQDFFNELKNAGAQATFVTDKDDEIELLFPNGVGAGYKTFDQLYNVCRGLVSKVFLGHADALDSIPKRSGAQDGSDTNPSTPATPVQKAMSDIRSADGRFVTPYINHLLYMLRRHGVGIPDCAVFRYANDDEEELAKSKEYQRSQAYATIAQTMKQAGLQMSPEQFTGETGIKCGNADGSMA